MYERKPYPFDFRAASSVFVRKITTKKRLTNEKTTKLFIEIYPTTTCSVHFMREPIILRQSTSETYTSYKPYRYIYIYFFLFPLVKHLWESLAIKTLSDLCVYIRHWLLYISNLGSRGTFTSHIKALPLVALITSLFFISVFFDTTRVLPILPVAVFLIKNINAFSATSQAVRKPRKLFRHHQHSVGIL